MNFFKNNLDKRWVTYSVSLCVAILFYMILSHLPIIWVGIKDVFDFIFPVFVGLVIAYVLNPLVKMVQKYIFKGVKKPRMNRGLSVLVTIILVIVLLTVFCVVLIPPMVSSVIGFLTNMEDYAKNLTELINTASTSGIAANIDLSKLTDFSDNALSTIVSYLTSNSDSVINTTISVGKGVVTGIIAFIVAIYLLVEKEGLQRGTKRLIRVIVTEDYYDAIADFWGKCNVILVRFICFDLVDGLIVGIANAIFMTIAGMPYIVLISVVVGVTNLAPTFGPIVGAIIGLFILVLVNPWYALAFLIFTLVLQTIDGYILKPKLFGDIMGVPPVWILISIIVFGRMFGVIGILLAIPFAAIIDFVYKDYVWVKLKEKKEARGEKVPD